MLTDKGADPLIPASSAAHPRPGPKTGITSAVVVVLVSALTLLLALTYLLLHQPEEVAAAEDASERRHAVQLGETIVITLQRPFAQVLTQQRLTVTTQAQIEERITSLGRVIPILEVTLYDTTAERIFSTDRSLNRPAASALPNVWDRSVTRPTRRDYSFFGQALTARNPMRLIFPLRADDGRGLVLGQVEIVLDDSDTTLAFTQLFDRGRWVLGVALVVIFAIPALGVLLLDRRRRRLGAALFQERQDRREATGSLRRIQDAMENTIHERTRRLRESEARFREFAESASDWLWETDDKHRFTYVSEGVRRLLGVDPKDLLGRTRQDIHMISDDSPARWQAFQDDLRARRPFRAFTYTMILPTGGQRHISISGSPVFDDKGRFRGYRGTGTDLTDRYESEQTITRLGRIVEDSASEIYIFSAESLLFQQVNRGARRNLGYGTDELAHMTPLDLCPGNDDLTYRNAINAARRVFDGTKTDLTVSGNETILFEVSHRRRDGSIYPVEIRLQYMGQESPPVFVAVVQDITERHHAAQALEESEERFRATADMSLDAIIVHVNGEIVYANKQSRILTGEEDSSALIGRFVDRIMTEDSRALLKIRMARMAADGKPAPRVEVRLQRLDGTTFEAELASVPITYGGKAAIQTVLRDITEEKAVQGHLVQTAKLATLGEMAAGMAHELSQPMNVIRMAAEAAALDLPGAPALAPETRSTFAIIAEQAARMGEIIDHMRIFSRKQPETTQTFDPAQTMISVLNLIEAQFYAENIQLTARYASGSFRVRGRPLQLEQVLLNLLTNARDSVRTRLSRTSGGRGVIGMAMDVTLEKDTITISVEDNGTGIAEDAFERLFEPFFTTKEVGAGTGLGLSVSFSLIAAMGGSLTAQNRADGPGAVFSITLPLVHCDALPGEDSITPLPPREKRARPLLALPSHAPNDTAADEEDDEPNALIPHILLVDDEAFAVKLIAEYLESLGYRVTTAGDGQEAYDKFLNDPPDLVVTDLRMPHSDGAELMSRIHQHIADLPVILATGHLGHLDSEEAIGSGAVAVLKKPISLQDLAQLIHHHVHAPGRT